MTNNKISTYVPLTASNVYTPTSVVVYIVFVWNKNISTQTEDLWQ